MLTHTETATATIRKQGLKIQRHNAAVHQGINTKQKYRDIPIMLRWHSYLSALEDKMLFRIVKSPIYILHTLIILINDTVF